MEGWRGGCLLGALGAGRWWGGLGAAARSLPLTRTHTLARAHTHSHTRAHTRCAGNYVKMVHNGIEYGDMQVGV